MTRDQHGDVEAQVRLALSDAPPVTPGHHALVAIAINLARKLDEGAGMATAGVAAELRATIADVLRETDDDEDERRFLASLSSPVGERPQA